MKLSEIRALAVKSLEAMLKKPTLWKATCTPGLRDDREERMATYLRSLTTNAELLVEEGAPRVSILPAQAGSTRNIHVFSSHDTGTDVTTVISCLSPAAARALAVELLMAADGEVAE